MGSTYWEEYYFRSAKQRTKVLSLLTKYLLQYKSVCIPGVGTLEIIQDPPKLNFAERLFTPPVFITHYLNKEVLTDHQVNYFAASNVEEREIIKEQLLNFGENFKSRIRQKPFEWIGLGTFHFDSEAIVFEPVTVCMPSLQTVPAVKVIRTDQDHQVLVGDKELSSRQAAVALIKNIAKRPVVILIGWIVLILAILAIIYILYMGNFNPGSSGLQWKVSGYITCPINHF